MDKDYLVTKSNYFIMNSSYDLSLEEQKIILTLASMVQPTDEEFKPYKFRIADFMDLIGVEDKSRYTEVPKITKELMKKVFEIEEGKKIIQVAWLSSAVYEKGSGMVELEFSPRLKPYMIKLNEVFTRYKLSNILSMKSKYSIRIYEILKCNAFKNQKYIEIDIDDLRKLLKTENMYPRYYDFRRFILEQAQKELKALTDLYFEFEELRYGRKVTSIKFYIKSNKDKTVSKPIALDETSATKEKDNYVKEEKRSTGLITAVKSIFKEDISDLEAEKILKASNRNIELVAKKYKLAQNTPNIKNIVGWIIDSLKNDYQSPKEKTNTNNFNNFNQRTYNFDKLERELLGWDKETNEPTGAYQQLIIKGEKD